MALFFEYSVSIDATLSGFGALQQGVGACTATCMQPVPQAAQHATHVEATWAYNHTEKEQLRQHPGQVLRYPHAWRMGHPVKKQTVAHHVVEPHWPVYHDLPDAKWKRATRIP